MRPQRTAAGVGCKSASRGPPDPRAKRRGRPAVIVGMPGLCRLPSRLLVPLFAITWGLPALANPVLSGADPDCAVFDGVYWLYPTGNVRGGGFKAYSSTDLRTWSDRGVIFSFKNAPWIAEDGRKGHGAWAPGILRSNDKFYLYYSVGPQDKDHPSRIGVAVADKPQGPFVDSGKALVIGGNGFEAIDAMAFADPKTGSVYLYAGGSAGAKLRVWELNDDRVTLKREIEVESPKEFTEGAFMHERDGVYYLSYSHGGWNSPNYSVHYATAEAPTGPWTYRGKILGSDATHKGPGHHSFVKNPKSGEWFIVYHRYETTSNNSPLKGQRRIAVDKVTYDADGAIKPVTMTDKPGPVSPIR